MTRILQPLEMQMQKAELQIQLECYKRIPTPKPNRQIPTVPIPNEKIPASRRKPPCVPKDQGTQGFQKEEKLMNPSIFYMIGFTLTMLLISLAEGLYRYVGARR